MSAQKSLESDSNPSKRLPNIFEQAPILESYNEEWNNITLESHNLVPGETLEYCLEHYVISMNMGQKVQVEQVIGGKSHQAPLFQGTSIICPIYSPHCFRWDNKLQTLSLNLKPELLNRMQLSC